MARTLTPTHMRVACAERAPTPRDLPASDTRDGLGWREPLHSTGPLKEAVARGKKQLRMRISVHLLALLTGFDALTSQVCDATAQGTR